MDAGSAEFEVLGVQVFFGPGADLDGRGGAQNVGAILKLKQTRHVSLKIHTRLVEVAIVT